MKERWLPVPGYPGYEASDQGNIRSLDRVVMYGNGLRNRKGVVLKPGLWRGKTGRKVKKPGRSQYCAVAIRNSAGRRVTRKVGHLVLLAHVGPPPFPGADCRHLDDNSLNDTLGNLAWGTRFDNAADRRRNGNSPAGERHPRSKLTDADVEAIRASAASGMTHQAISEQYNVTQPTISKIVVRRAWSHIQEKENSVAL